MPRNSAVSVASLTGGHHELLNWYLSATELLCKGFCLQKLREGSFVSFCTPGFSPYVSFAICLGTFAVSTDPWRVKLHPRWPWTHAAGLSLFSRSSLDPFQHSKTGGWHPVHSSYHKNWDPFFSELVRCSVSGLAIPSLAGAAAVAQKMFLMALIVTCCLCTESNKIHWITFFFFFSRPNRYKSSTYSSLSKRLHEKGLHPLFHADHDVQHLQIKMVWLGV